MKTYLFLIAILLYTAVENQEIPEFVFKIYIRGQRCPASWSPRTRCLPETSCCCKNTIR